jgi:hypothetical protein
VKHAAQLVALVLFSAALPASVPNPHAVYVSGTAAIPNGAEGSLNLGHPTELRFNYDSESFELPYERITSMELADKPGVKAHLAAAVGWVPKVGKTQEKMLTIAFKDENGVGEVAVFEIAKLDYQTLASVLKARTGKPVQSGNAKEPSSAGATPDPATALVPVTIESVPNGAFVSFWGQSVGKTPVTTRLAPGSYTVEISASGLPVWTREIVVEAGKPLKVSAELGHRVAPVTVSVR